MFTGSVIITVSLIKLHSPFAALQLQRAHAFPMPHAASLVTIDVSIRRKKKEDPPPAKHGWDGRRLSALRGEIDTRRGLTCGKRNKCVSVISRKPLRGTRRNAAHVFAIFAIYPRPVFTRGFSVLPFNSSHFSATETVLLRETNVSQRPV